jgi:hypothetical protein
MFVPIPGLGVLRSADRDKLLLEPDLNPDGTSFGPQDVLPSGQKAALAVWMAVLKEEVPLDGKQVDALAQFILEGL